MTSRPNSDRLRLARAIRGRTLSDFAGIVGCSNQAIAKMEAGEVDYSRHVERLSVALDLPPGFFFQSSPPPVTAADLSFRSQKSLLARSKTQIAARASLAADLECALFPVGPTEELPDLSAKGPTGAAREIRYRLGYDYGPVSNLLDRLERIGLAVYYYREANEKSAGASFWDEGRPFIFLNSQPRSAQRENWTLAHELGHLVLRHARRRDSYQLEECEHEANYFAAEFLMPESTFGDELPIACVFHEYERLKRRWNVSIQAMVRRAFQLKRISKWQYEDMFRRISMRGMRKIEPGDCEPAESLRLLGAIESLRLDGTRVSDFLWHRAAIPEELALELVPVLKYHL